MPRPEQLHHADEFGRGPAITEVVGPGSADADGMLGPGVIQLDGIVENESGRTPPPPAVTPQQMALTFGVIFVVGLLLVWVLFAWLLPWAFSIMATLR